MNAGEQGSEPRRKVWFCKIGECEPDDVPEYGDEPMRERVERAYKLVTGKDPDFIFSGWGGELEESERAVVEDRLPDRDLQVAAAERRLQVLRGLEVGEPNPENRVEIQRMREEAYAVLEGTVSELRRWTVRLDTRLNTMRAFGPWLRSGERVEVMEVGSGHDEQTEDAVGWARTAGEHGAELLRALTRAERAEAALVTERERTVAAVVEALREYAANSPDYGAAPINAATDRIEQRFGSSVSGGD